jgi:phage-related protein
VKEIPRPVKFFATEAGSEPAREFLQELPKNERIILGEDIKAAQWSNPWRKPIVDSLGKGLWEVRSTLPNTIARILFFEYDGTMILLHGFKKKTQQTPTDIIKLANSRKKLYENAHQTKKQTRRK